MIPKVHSILKIDLLLLYLEISTFQATHFRSHRDIPEVSMNISARIPSVFQQTEAHAFSQIVWIGIFVVATALGARVEIPTQPVPFTLQTLFVLLAGALLGPRNGALSQLVYLAMGILGAPVFASGAMGIARILGPTGGYLLSFPVAAMCVGYLIPMHRSLVWTFISMFAGLLLIFLFGTLQLYMVAIPDWGKAFGAGFLIFSWWDMIKLSAAAMMYHELAKRWSRKPH
jgi:biotin transport system substrate-specific component